MEHTGIEPVAPTLQITLLHSHCIIFIISNHSLAVLLAVFHGGAIHDPAKHLGKIAARAESAFLTDIKYTLISGYKHVCRPFRAIIVQVINR